MARIRQLSKHLINQIAAGEVIERPASVVKELTENSVDAGATRISVEITNDCRDIRVADNGSGIHPDDIMLAFSKHATSKLQNDEDLFEIRTMGFRGEALASIISISKLTCTTRTKDYDTGKKVKCENSEVKQVETGCAVGTIMEIKDLFYNIPVRLKFLRNPNTEFSYIQEIVQSLALVNTKIAFELKRNGKTVLKTTGQGDLALTIKEVYSSDIVENLKPVLKTDELSRLKISGMVSTPNFTRSSKKYHLYINSRSVKCPVLQKAVDTVYKTLISNGKYPFVVLNLEIPPHDVDVNVHPTKKEVRYRNTNQIFNFVRTSVEGGLTNFVEQEYKPIPASEENVVEFKPIQKEVRINKEEDTMYVSDSAMQKFEEEFIHQEPVIQQQTIILPTEYKEPEPEENIIGQYKNTYILIEKEDGLEIVDQHIAEERYIYEKLKSEKEVASQILFISDVVSIEP
ncbi:DNA mismatch repair endonuclease MutL, partial [bacterium]|nr:DNA mismatch repair endonuclease MutL [bacterium]